MPLYEYRCDDCHTTFEKFVRSFSSHGEIRCPECNSEDVNKAFSTFATSGTTTKSSTPAAASCAPSGGG